jgi:hypothetical protein
VVETGTTAGCGFQEGLAAQCTQMPILQHQVFVRRNIFLFEGQSLRKQELILRSVSLIIGVQSFTGRE